MTITQHAHIYSFHTSNFNFGEIFFLFFLSLQPLEYDCLLWEGLMRSYLVVLEREPWFILLAETGRERPSNLLVQFFARAHSQVQQAMILGQTRCQQTRKQTREQVFLGEQS